MRRKEVIDLGKFKSRMYSFFGGRYGTDALYYFLFAIALLLLVINVFVGSFVASLILYGVAASLLVWGAFRSFSRNISRRRRENEVFTGFFRKVFSPFVLAKNKFRDRKTHKYIRCKKCRAVIRVKRIPGNHFLHCPKCLEKIEVTIKERKSNKAPKNKNKNKK